MPNVRIRGDGVAAFACARLLQQAGSCVSLERAQDQSRRPRLPAILISDRALHLVRDVFGRGDLLSGQPSIRKRVVAWGPQSEPRTFDHSAVVVSEQTLLGAISPVRPSERDHNAGWTIFSSPPLPPPVTGHRFGSRVASAAPVTLKDNGEPPACWIESLETGWLFLIADSPGSGWILSVGAPPEPLLGQSRVVAPQIASCGASMGEFPACPRIASQLCGQEPPTHGSEGARWLACGTAAMAFDPLAGDGAAHSIREAILAAAVIRAIDMGGNPGDLFSHYEARMIAAFERHLALCLEFYRAGPRGEWWDSECRALGRGLDWCRRKTGDRTQFQYQLNGFDLELVGREAT